MCTVVPRQRTGAALAGCNAPNVRDAASHAAQNSVFDFMESTV
jgi:hypothetical protein